MSNQQLERELERELDLVKQVYAKRQAILDATGEEGVSATHSAAVTTMLHELTTLEAEQRRAQRLAATGFRTMPQVRSLDVDTDHPAHARLRKQHSNASLASDASGAGFDRSVSRTGSMASQMWSALMSQVSSSRLPSSDSEAERRRAEIMRLREAIYQLQQCKRLDALQQAELHQYCAQLKQLTSATAARLDADAGSPPIEPADIVSEAESGASSLVSSTANLTSAV